MPVAPILRKMVGIMGRLVCDIGEKRLAVTVIGIDEADELVSIGLCSVIVLWKLCQVFAILSKKGVGS